MNDKSIIASQLDADLLQYHGHLQTTVDEDGLLTIFDPVRRKHVAATPEEYVRQLLVCHLHSEWNVGYGRISIERGYKQAEGRRYDVLIHRTDGSCSLLAECKSFRVSMPKDILWQVAQYDEKIGADHILITNGHQSYLWDRRRQIFIQSAEEGLSGCL